MNQYLTPAVVRQFGAALGLWAHNLDVDTAGRGQGDMPDFIGVEETAVYGAILQAIEKQDPPRVIRKEVDGVALYAETRPSELYLLMREAMLEAYRQQDGH
jgi:hypothetical protein